MRVLSLHPSTSAFAIRERRLLRMSDDGKGGEGGDGGKAGDGTEGDKGKGGDGGKDEGFKGRISDLTTKLKERDAELETFRKKEKDRADDEAKAKGEHARLLQERDQELTKLRGDHDARGKTLDSYEKAAKARIDKRLADVKDEKKRESIQKLLDGRSVLDQDLLLDEALALAGGSNAFGGGTPLGNQPGADTKESMEKELDGLVRKLENGTALTPEEGKRQRELERKLRELKSATK